MATHVNRPKINFPNELNYVKNDMKIKEPSSSPACGNTPENDLSQKRKEPRRPERQIYRPGMGLRHRNAEKEATTESLPIQDLCIDNNRSCSSTPTPSHSKNYNVHTKTTSPESPSPKVKNRRPDLQVYLPKNRCNVSVKNGEDAPELNLSDGDVSKHSSNADSSGKLTKKEESITAFKKNHDTLAKNKLLKNKSPLSSPTTRNQNGNISEHSATDSSGSRSTPEGFSEDNCHLNFDSLKFSNNSHISHKNVKNFKQSFDNNAIADVKILKDDTEKNNTKKYLNWADHEYDESDNASDNEAFSKGTTIFKQSKTIENSVAAKQSEDSLDVNFSSKAHDKTHSGRDHPKLQEKKSPGLNGGSLVFTRSRKNSGSLPDNRERKPQREKLIHDLPPRFQKQREKFALNASDSKISVTQNAPLSNGILRLPAEALNVETVKPNPDTDFFQGNHPPQYSQFVHKQLFNPKNPSVPEIVNIPTPPTMCNFVSGNHGMGFVSNNLLSDSPLFVPSSRNLSGYIPPPQPPLPIRNPYPAPIATLMNLHEHRSHNSPYISAGIIPPALCTNSNMGPISHPVPIQPPVFGSEFPPAEEGEKRRLKPIVEKNLREINLLDRELSSSISRGLSPANLSSLGQKRWKLQLRYENIILADPRYCAENNTEQGLWKSAYYQLIEAFRKRLEDQPEDQELLKKSILNLVNEGTVFFENLLEKLQETHGFTLEHLLEVESLTNQPLPEGLRLVLISCQKLLIYLGDLARYKEQASGTSKYGKARSLYLKAQQLAPKNGRPYHQLALLALCAKRKLDAVYYFMRSLSASNPFLCAREYLLSLFDDAKKMYELYQKKRQDDVVNEMAVISADLGERNEVWIKPDGSKIQRDSVFEISKCESEFKKLSSAELNKRFISSFLHVHGKLFTKVGMESFDDIVKQMLKEFYCLLQRSPFPLESNRLLQLAAINMYSVNNASNKDDDPSNSLFQMQALSVAQAMACMLMQRCCVMYMSHLESPDYPKHLISDDMSVLFPSVKIWTDWMSCQRDLWPLCIYCLKKGSQWGLDLDVWSAFAELLTLLRDIDTSALQRSYDIKKDMEEVVLEEDKTLCGFQPLLNAVQDSAYVNIPFEKERGRHLQRTNRIQFFGDYLCGIETPYLEFDVEQKRFNSLVSSLSEKDGSKAGSDLWESLTDDSLGDDSVDSDEVILNSSVDETNELRMLWFKKDALSRAKAQQDKHNARMQAVLRKNQTLRPIVLQIQPRYLVPDTNCFVDYLQELQELLALKTFQIVVPLIVINELDGLAKGSRENPHSTPEHSSNVTAFSRAAVTFLEQEFANRNPQLRAITSKGSVIDTISYRIEEVGCNKRGSNDDLILSCCLFYCKDRPEQYMKKDRDEPLQLLREVVLLTEDRNLRVKALTHNVPTRDLESFLKWAKS